MTMFARAVCGVDGSDESLEAVRQVDLVLAEGGRLVLVAAVDLSDTIHFQIAPTAIHAARRALEKAAELDRAALDDLAQARALVRRTADVDSVEVAGPPAACLLDVVAAPHAHLAAVGTHGRGRATGIALGSVATRILHRAPCSVLVARRPPSGEWAPRVMVVGVDGSNEAEVALETAHGLAPRLGARVEAVTIESGRITHGLVEAAENAGLLVVGSRGTHGARSLGSVSERVAHEAPCSVLVVRAGYSAPRPRLARPGPG